MRKVKHYRTGDMGWSRDSHLIANIAAAVAGLATLGMLLLAVYFV